MIDDNYKNDYVEEALGRITQQFKGKPLVEGWIAAVVLPVQDQEDQSSQLIRFRWLDAAQGTQLDGLGELVGEARRGRGDNEYRLAIQAKIAINNAKGTPNETINIFALLTGSNKVELREYFPGHVELYGNNDYRFTITGNGPDAFAFDGGIDGLGFGSVFDSEIGGEFAGVTARNMAKLYRTMDGVVAAGVRVDWLGLIPDIPFSFDGDPAGLGFGSVFDVTIGGKFASLIPRT